MQTCTTVLRFSIANWKHWPFLHCSLFSLQHICLSNYYLCVLCTKHLDYPGFFMSPVHLQKQGLSRIFSFNCLVQCFSLFKVLPVFFKYLRRIQTPSSFEKARLSPEILHSSLKIHWTWSRKHRKLAWSLTKLLPCLPPLTTRLSSFPCPLDKKLSQWKRFLYRFLTAHISPEDPLLPFTL